MSITLGFLAFSSRQETNSDSMYIHVVIKAALARSGLKWSVQSLEKAKLPHFA